MGRPSFLKDFDQKQVDWDKLVKNDTEGEEPNIHLAEGGGNYTAIAPPKEIDDSSKHSKKVHSSLTAAIINTYSNTSGEISAPPVRYTAKEIEPKFRTVSDNTEEESHPVTIATKRAPPTQIDEEGHSKKLKSENFRQKEKRKRDMGQTSRGKSYVEEEKRVLRQSFSTDEIMS